MSSKQDRLLREIIDSLPPARIFVAAGLMMRLRRADLPPNAEIPASDEEVISFIEQLDLRGLRQLRRVAQELEDRTLH
jgi:hypothetical protein